MKLDYRFIIFCHNLFREVRKVTLNNLAARTPESISSDDQLIGEEEELVNGHEARPSKPDESNDFIEPLSDVFVHLMDIKTGKVEAIDY